MGSDIYDKYPVAKQVLDDAEDILQFNLKKLMFQGPQTDLNLTSNAQPAILAHSIALLRVLETEYDFDVKQCVYAMGHSLGEYSALVATGSIKFEDALKLVRSRGHGMQESIVNKPFAMQAMMIRGNSIEEIENIMDKLSLTMQNGEIAEIANINSKTQIVLSGTAAGVNYAASILSSNGLVGRGLPLPVSAPFHCSLMAPAAQALGNELSKYDFIMPSIEVLSNVNAKPYVSKEEIPKLLKKQVTEPVQWQRCMKYAKDGFVFDWIVLGPSKVLANIVKKEYPHDKVTNVSTIEDLEKFKI